jgi:hypothetical protein
METTPPNPIDGYKERIMAKFTVAQIEEHAKKAMEAFEDGFQWSDVFTLVPEVMEIVEDVKEMSGAEKEESALAIIDYVIDNTDTPWIPDNLTDPLLKKGARFMIPMIIKASKGELKLNVSAPEADA